MAILFVQNKAFNNIHPGSPYVVTLDNSTTSGNALLVAFQLGTGNPTVSITDNKGNTYTKIANYTGTQLIEVWYAIDIVGGSSHQLTITPTIDSTMALNIEEWSGLATFGAFDKTVSASGTGASIDSGATATTTQANELVFACTWDNAFKPDVSPAAVSVGAGFSNLVDITNAFHTESKVVSSTGTYNGLFTIDSSGGFLSTPSWDALVATFRGVLTTEQTQTGTARIEASIERTQIGFARITTTTSRTQTGIATVIASASRTQTGIATISDTASRTIIGRSSIIATSTQSISGVATVEHDTWINDDNGTADGWSDESVEFLLTESGEILTTESDEPIIIDKPDRTGFDGTDSSGVDSPWVSG